MATVTLLAQNLTTGVVVQAPGAINVAVGDNIIIYGSISPMPSPCTCCLTNDCVEIDVVSGQTTGSIGTVGLNPDSSYLYGPTLIPNTPTFSVQADYLPGTDVSPVLQFIVGTSASPTISLVGASGAPGSSMNISGSNFEPGSLATLSGFGGQIQKSENVSSTGTWNDTILVPMGVQPGVYSIQATDVSGKQSNIVQYTVVQEGGQLYTVSIHVVDITTGQHVDGPGTIDVSEGDDIEISGIISPSPPDCSNCVEIDVVWGPSIGSIGTVGIGALGPGNYLYGPAAIPSGQQDFAIVATYLPTGVGSPQVTINVTKAELTYPTSIEVINAASKVAIQGSVVSITSSSGVLWFTGDTDSSGKISVMLPQDTYTFTATAKGFAEGTGMLTVTVSGGSSVVGLVPSMTSSYPTVTTDMTSYVQGDRIHYTGSGFTPNGPVQSCITTNGGSNVICIPNNNADGNGNVSGSMLVGTNIPPGPQQFILEDVDAGLTALQNITVTAASNIFTVTILVTNVTTGESVSGGGTLNAAVGDSIQISGAVSPNPPSCSSCVNIQATNGSIGTVGLGAIGVGNYLYGPTPIPAGSTNFTVRAVYTPSGDASPTVTVNLSSGTPPPPAGTNILGAAVLGSILVIVGGIGYYYSRGRKKRAKT